MKQLLVRAGAGLQTWMEERLGLGALLAAQKKLILKPVPRGLSWPYTMGSVALFLFSLQFLTGFLLLTRYVADASGAYRSVEDIQHRVPLGWLVRGMHAWGASLIVAALLAHMVKVLWYGGYKRPREATWFAGVFLFLITLTFSFTGYLLPWNQLARWATAVGTDAIDDVPLVGAYLGELVRGGPQVSGRTLGRFFAVHVMALPAVLAALLAVHLALVQKHGISTHLPTEEERAFGYRLALERSGGAEPFFPRQFYRDLLAANVAFAVLVALAAWWPWELGEPASETTPEGIKPEWYFLPVYQFLKYFDGELVAAVPLLGKLGISAESLGLFVVNLAGLAFLLLPLLDRGKERRISRRPVFAAVAGAGLLGVTVLGLLGHWSGRTVEFPFGTYRFTPKGMPARVEPGALAAGEAPRAPAGGGALLAAAGSPAGSGPGPSAGGNSGPSAGGNPAPSGNSAAASGVEEAAGAAAGTCGSCHRHERPLSQWREGVHAQGPRPAAACVDCHGGDRAAEDKDKAHQGILTRKTRRGAVVTAKPEGAQVVEACGKCHGEIVQAFSADHLGMEPARSCFSCHSNHRIARAGLSTFALGYADPQDPRTARFETLRGRAAHLEQDWDIYARAVGGLQAALREHEAPLEDFEEDLAAARDLRRESHVSTHALDVERFQKKAAEAREAMGRARKGLEERFQALESRKRLAAAVGTLSLVFAGMLGLALRRERLRRER